MIIINLVTLSDSDMTISFRRVIVTRPRWDLGSKRIRILGQRMKKDIIDGRDERLTGLVNESHASTLSHIDYEQSEGNCDPLQWIVPLSYRQKIHHFVCARRKMIAAMLDLQGKQPGNRLTKGKNHCYKCVPYEMRGSVPRSSASNACKACTAHYLIHHSIHSLYQPFPFSSTGLNDWFVRCPCFCITCMYILAAYWVVLSKEHEASWAMGMANSDEGHCQENVKTITMTQLSPRWETEREWIKSVA